MAKLRLKVRVQTYGIRGREAPPLLPFVQDVNGRVITYFTRGTAEAVLQARKKEGEEVVPFGAMEFDIEGELEND